MNPTLQFLTSARVNGIMQGITDPRLLPGILRWNDRVPDVDAAEEELTAKYVGTLVMADLIMDDAKAVVKNQGRFQFETTKVPNIKLGIGLNQTMLNTLNRIQQMGGVQNDDVNLFTNYQARLMANVKYGVQLRKEVLKLGMLLDTYSADRLGIKMQGVSWGMYSDLKITPTTGWQNTSATPITDINNARAIASQHYNMNLDRATMSTPALRAMVATTEFANQVKNVYLATALGAPTPSAPIQNDSLLRSLAERIIAGTGEPFSIEIDDRRFWDQDNAGTITSGRVHPINKVLLTSTANDGNANAYDFANGVCTESIVGDLVPNTVIGGIPMGRGPIAYTTLADAHVNPPGIVVWGVARGFPRKHQQAASSVLTVGTLTETYDPTLPAVL